jgi:AhpD family alkylhydroperoxidase
MSESQTKLNENRKKQLDLLQRSMEEAIPDLASGVALTWKGAYADGALSAKVKHLMAMVLALGAGCRNCVLAQTESAVDDGATRQEFLEALAVAISMRGTTGVAESLRVVQYLDERGIW